MVRCIAPLYRLMNGDWLSSECCRNPAVQRCGQAKKAEDNQKLCDFARARSPQICKFNKFFPNRCNLELFHAFSDSN